VTIDRDLREKSYGEAEGRPKAWLEQRRILLPEVGERLRHSEGLAGAETRMDLARRAYAAMERVRAASGDRRIVVTHGGTATFLIASWIGLPIEASGLVDFRTSAGSITVLRKDPRTFSHQVVRLNDVSHLN
jgi:probable phosphoglycerate mutase